VESPTEEEYVKRRVRFKGKGWLYDAVKYCEGWLVWDQKLVSYILRGEEPCLSRVLLDTLKQLFYSVFELFLEI